LGTSTGPQGKYFLVVTSDISIVAGNTAQAEYACITSASTLTTVSQTYTNINGVNPCQLGPAGQLAGDPLFGLAPTVYGASTIYEAPLFSHLEWTGTAANATAPVFVVKVAGNGTTSITVYGSSRGWAIPI
jgi:hypothetical protein